MLLIMITMPSSSSHNVLIRHVIGAPASKMDDGKAGCDEITIREPQYVFAVNGCLMASRHSEEDDFTD